MSINGGFPPIEYIKVPVDKEKDTKIEMKRERFFATIPKKNLDIRQILSNSAKRNMINVNKNEVHIINTF